MKAIILAGGLGTRLKPFTQIIPKPLLPIGERSLLEIQIEHLKECGFNEIILATNFRSEYIENFFGDGSRYGVSLKVSKEQKPLGTVGPITLLKDELTEPFLMMNGDIITQFNFYKFYEYAVRRDSLLSVSIKEMITPFQFGNIFFDGDYVTKIEEKPNIKTNILAGIYILKPDIFNFIPNDEYFGMDDLINKMLNLKLLISKFHIKEYWLDIGQIDDFQMAQEKYNEHFNPGSKI